jgi:hypothetical protein
MTSNLGTHSHGLAFPLEEWHNEEEETRADAVQTTGHNLVSTKPLSERNNVW